MGRPSLGILIAQSSRLPEFAEKNYFEQISTLASKENIQTIVFSPEWVNWSAQMTFGFFFDKRENRWADGVFPLPRVIYDRCFITSRNRSSYEKLKRLRSSQTVTFMNVPLSGKWKIHQILRNYETIRPYLPQTEHYEEKSLDSWLNNYQRIFIKPVNGTQGLGILCVSKTEDGAYIIQGRISPKKSINQTFPTLFELKKILKTLVRNKKYIVQEGLDLTTKSGSVFDVRVLMQKESSEEWKMTGSAVRQGKAGVITSNLHSGGNAQELHSFLNEHFPPEAVASILSQIEVVSKQLPTIMETHHVRLCELGLDFGIDQSGRVWLLEINSKPGRKVFNLKELQESKRLSLVRPICYAQYLTQRKIGG